MDDSEVIVLRWRRYGHDRLYATRSTGEKIGWWDLKTEEGHPESPSDAAALTAAVRDWQAREHVGAVDTAAPVHPSVASRASASPAVEPAAEAVVAVGASAEAATRPWLDLSTNAPGAEAREQAVAAWDDAPVRSVLGRVLGVHTEERGWRIGADGEEKVAARLAKIVKKDPRWRVLHAIPVGSRGADIDHLVIGPGGIFTLNSKHHPGAKIWVGGNTFLVDGHKQPYIRNSRHEAERASKLLEATCGFPVHVEGVVVTVNAADVVVKSQPADVHVVPRMQISRWFGRHGEIYSEPMLQAVYDAARRSTTWRP